MNAPRGRVLRSLPDHAAAARAATRSRLGRAAGRSRAAGLARAAAALLLSALAAVALAVSPGCSDGQPRLQPARPDGRALIEVAGRPLRVELAVTDVERDRGLMHRTRLEDDAGMLFLFPDAAPRRFWMRNTLIPLDIVFLGEDGSVQNIARGEPGVESPGYYSRYAARMVLEVNAGWCERAGLRPGDRIEVPPELLELARP